MNTPSNQLLLAVARHAAMSAGNHAFTNLDRRLDANIVARHDVKHKLDVECEAIATRAILDAFPDHAILGEESASDDETPPEGVQWVIDPIDGTVNFFHGLPNWCCSVAARIGGKSVAGAVFSPELGLCFTATADGPALCNGRELRVSATAETEKSIVATGADKSEDPSRAFRFFNAIGKAVQRPRILGSAALDLCFVASGKADGYFEHGIFIWDVAAASLILERAGGRCEVLRRHGGHRMAFLGTNGLIHDSLRSVIVPELDA